MKKSSKLVSILLSVLLIISIIPAYNFSVFANETLDMSVSFIDCGQGDSVLILSEGASMLVDAGKAKNVQAVLNYIDALGITKIDYAVSSHPDEDHIGGMPSIYEKYQVNESIYSPFVADTLIYNDYMSAVESEPDSNYHTVNNNDTWIVGDAVIEVVFDGKGGANANDSSLVLKVSCGNTTLLLTGDISKSAENNIVSTGKDIDIDILKVAHHGSSGSSSEAFLNAATPQIAVISVGAGNSYGHPANDALERLSAVCPRVYRTDLDGTVVLCVDNNVIKYKNNALPPVSYCKARTVYVTQSGSKYHASMECSNMKNPIAKKLDEAKKLGYSACSKCVSENFELSKILHKATDWLVDRAATPVNVGSKHKECAQCGEILETDVIPRLSFNSPVKVFNATLYGYNDVKITWDRVNYAEKYKIYYKKSGAADYTYKATTGNLYYSFKNLSDGVKYIFKIVPCIYLNGKCVENAKNKTASVYTLKKVVMKNVKKSGSKKVKVSWKNLSGESGYQISMSTSKSKTKIVSTYATTTAKSKTVNTKKGKTYYYKVRAYKTVAGKKIYGPWSSVKAYKLK